jgi:hypothetical protein
VGIVAKAPISQGCEGQTAVFSILGKTVENPEGEQSDGMDMR